MTVNHHIIPGCCGEEIKTAICGTDISNGEYIFRMTPFFRNFKMRSQNIKNNGNDIITFVNHPYNRFVYYWNNTQHGTVQIPIIKLIKNYLSKYSDLNDFIVNGEEDYNLLTSIKSQTVFQSMSYFCEGEWNVYNNIYNCENLQTQVQKFIDDYNITVEGGLPTVSEKVFDGATFTVNDLSSDSKELIYERHKPDFDKFGFTR